MKTAKKVNWTTLPDPLTIPTAELVQKKRDDQWLTLILLECGGLDH